MGQILKHPIIGGMLNFDKHHYTYFTVCPFSFKQKPPVCNFTGRIYI